MFVGSKTWRRGLLEALDLRRGVKKLGSIGRRPSGNRKGPSLAWLVAIVVGPGAGDGLEAATAPKRIANREESAKPRNGAVLDLLKEFLGDERARAIFEKLPDTEQQSLQGVLDGSVDIETRWASKQLAHALCSLLTQLGDETLALQVAQMDAKRLGGGMLALGYSGRKAVMGCVPRGVVGAVMAKLDNQTLIEMGYQGVRRLRSYAAILAKRERIDGDLQDEEQIRLKYRRHPTKAFYMSWIDGPYKGRELLYNETLVGKDRIRVREAGIMGVVAVTLDTGSSLAKRGTNHRATDVGFEHILFLMSTDVDKTEPHGLLRRIDHGLVSYAKSTTYKVEYQMVAPEGVSIYCKKLVVWIDPESSLPVRVDIYKDGKNLLESYAYSQLQFNPALSSLDFDPKNPDYDL